MCQDDEANEENLKKVHQFVQWFKELTGKDMQYSVRANVVTLHNDDDFDDDSEEYECTCNFDDSKSSDSDCESCKKGWKKEKSDHLF